MLKCKICKYKGKQLHQHIKKCHNMNSIEYRERFGLDLKMQEVSIIGKRRRAETIKKTGGSQWSIRYWVSKGMELEDAKVKVSELQKINNSKRQYTPNDCILNVQYWINNHNMTYVQAVDKISQLQSDRSKRSSKFKGHVHSKESKISISNSMSKHIKSVGKGVWIQHFGNLSGGISKAEIECYNYIKANICTDLEASVIVGNKVVDMIYKSNVIEFNGDYWHANPSKYKKDDLITYPGGNIILAEDVWNKDANRISYLKSLGLDVFIIWEDMWMNNREVILKELKEFLC